MTEIHYPVLALWDDPTRAWYLVAPDFPEATSWAPEDISILRQAEDMLGTVIDFRRERGEALPEPDEDRVDKLTADWPKGSRRHRLFYVLVARDAPAPEPVRVNISMDKHLLARIDKEADRRGRTRSGFLAEGARRLLRESARDPL